jgi:hypothetical protein
MNLTTLHEASRVMDASQLKCMVWDFANCPLQEIKEYEAAGNEALVIVCRSNDFDLLQLLGADTSNYSSLSLQNIVPVETEGSYTLYVAVPSSEPEFIY